MPEGGGSDLHVHFVDKEKRDDAGDSTLSGQRIVVSAGNLDIHAQRALSNEFTEDQVNMLNLSLATFLSSIGTGLIAIAVSKLIETAQEMGFPGGTKNPVTILVSVTLGGCFGAISWFWLRGKVNQNFVQVADSIKGAKMRPVVTLINGAIQDIVVALGGSFGREAAPREIAAMWAGEVCDFLETTPIDRSLLVACGTGAGLAAVYSCPISGVLYTLEHTLHWKISFKAVVLATITSGLATYVSSVAVETTHGLYHIETESEMSHGKYSYQWPDRRLLFWSAVMGLIVVIPALCFRHAAVFVKKKQPKARLPAGNPEAGDIVWIYDDDLQKKSKVVVLDRDGHREDKLVTVWWMNSDRQRTFTAKQWRDVRPEGRRNNLILIWMPVASFALAVGAIRFPELLGNGAALARSALKNSGEGGLDFASLFILFALKIMYTLGILASGAVGGTLTPSVSLGAVLGTILTRKYRRYYWPTMTEKTAKALATVSAASFLSVAMQSPVTSGFLLLEFTAQAVDHKDLIEALGGNFEPLIKSKLAAGMVIPLFVAILTAYLFAMAVETAAKKCTSRKKLKAKRYYRTPSAQDMDLVQEQDDWSPDDLTQEAGVYCAQMGILISTFILNAEIVVRWQHIYEEPSVAFEQYLFRAARYTWIGSAIAGLCTWLLINYMNSYKEDEPLLSQQIDEDSGEESLRALRTHTSAKSHYVRSLSRTGGSPLIGDVLPLAWAALCAFFASVIPYVPWVLETRSKSPARVPLQLSIGCSMCAFALFKALIMANELMKHHGTGRAYSSSRRRRRDFVYAIPKSMLYALLTAGAGGLTGFLYNTFNSSAH